MVMKTLLSKIINCFIGLITFVQILEDELASEKNTVKEKEEEIERLQNQLSQGGVVPLVVGAGGDTNREEASREGSPTSSPEAVVVAAGISVEERDRINRDREEMQDKMIESQKVCSGEKINFILHIVGIFHISLIFKFNRKNVVSNSIVSNLISFLLQDILEQVSNLFSSLMFQFLLRLILSNLCRILFHLLYAVQLFPWNTSVMWKHFLFVIESRQGIYAVRVCMRM